MELGRECLKVFLKLSMSTFLSLDPYKFKQTSMRQICLQVAVLTRQLWGYDRVDELIWVKTNQLQVRAITSVHLT